MNPTAMRPPKRLRRFLSFGLFVIALSAQGCTVVHLLNTTEDIGKRVETGSRVIQSEETGASLCSIQLSLQGSDLAVTVQRQYIGTHKVERSFKTSRSISCKAARTGPAVLCFVLLVVETATLLPGFFDLMYLATHDHSWQCEYHDSLPDLVDSVVGEESFDEVRLEQCTVEVEFQNVGKWPVVCGSGACGTLKLGPEHAKNALLGRETQIVARVVKSGVEGSATLTIPSARFRELLEGKR